MSSETTYTYEEVKRVLCEGCRMDLTSLLVSEHHGPNFYHTINGNRIECLASDWRVKANREGILNHEETTT